VASTLVPCRVEGRWNGGGALVLAGLGALITVFSIGLLATESTRESEGMGEWLLQLERRDDNLEIREIKLFQIFLSRQVMRLAILSLPHALIY